MIDQHKTVDTICKLSVIIPCYNEKATLQRCIASVINIASAGSFLRL